MSRLDEIEARLSAATPGPWAIGTNEKNCLIIGSRQTQGWVCVGDPDAAPEAQDDAALIAHAPEDLSALVAVVKAVRRVAEDAALPGIHRATIERRLRAALSVLEES